MDIFIIQGSVYKKMHLLELYFIHSGIFCVDFLKFFVTADSCILAIDFYF